MKSRRNKAIAGWDRIDVGFRELLQNVRHRLFWNKIIQNLAHRISQRLLGRRMIRMLSILKLAWASPARCCDAMLSELRPEEREAPKPPSRKIAP
jgi:hypothetical protein